MVRLTLAMLLISGCAIYDPMISSCSVRCSNVGSCPSDTLCVDGFCKRAEELDVTCACRPGEVRRCQRDDLQCAREGVQTCLPQFAWGTCVYEIAPEAERCNGLDDDCDGVIDEDTETGPLCTLTRGVCLGASQQCAGGQWNACDENRYGSDYERSETRCDGLDNDCDGVVDQGAAVRVTDQRSGELWLFQNPPLVLVNVDGGVLRAAFDDGLVLRDRSFLPGIEAVAASPNRVMTASIDGGVAVLGFDGGVQRFADVRRGTLSDWGVALAFTDAGITLFVDDGVTRDLGLDDGGALRFSDRGGVLLFPGGVYEWSNDDVFGTGVSAVRAISEEPALAALPVDQPTDGRAPVVVFLRSLDRTPVALFGFALESLHDFQLSGNSLGNVVAALARDGGVRLIDDVGVFEVQTPGPVETLRLVPDGERRVFLAVTRDSGVELFRSCLK